MERTRERKFPKLAKEPLLTSRLRGDRVNRLWAKVIDFALVSLCSLPFLALWPKVLWVLLPLTWTFLDRMGRGQSPGKWLLGLHTIEGLQGRKPNPYQCLIRNIPCLGLSLSFICSGAGAWALFIVSFALCLMELYFFFALRSGLRVGDVFANTRVFDYKDEHTQFIEQFLKESDASP
ncbi:MAG: RDD family protein [Bdellovibrionales bacterium]|nr:RDD family protein [Bdellovibrionales bacterium]